MEAIQTKHAAPTMPQKKDPIGNITGEGNIEVATPIDAVFKFWETLENLPQFMEHVQEVKTLAPGRTAWRVAGPLGTQVSWEAVTTRVRKNSEICWQSVPGSEVDNSGIVRFSPLPEGGTRIEVRLAYTPPAGKLGHAVASMFGVNPEQQIASDLKSLRTLLDAAHTINQVTN